MVNTFTIDLKFQHYNKTIASYLVPIRAGAILFETGPGSTIGELIKQLAIYGLKPGDVKAVFVSHIHLDHAGAAGWLASQGAQIFVHPIGLPHFVNPEKLLSSARRIYAEKMDVLWGEFLPVSEFRITSVDHQEEIHIDDLRIMAIHTPGHAEHHISWLLDDICFTGDIAGVRMPNQKFIQLPLVPPELDFGKWKNSLEILIEVGFTRIAPTHFGIFDDVSQHLNSALAAINENQVWMEENIKDGDSIDDVRVKYSAFQKRKFEESGTPEELINLYEIANPSWISADGIFRFWKKTISNK